LKIVLVNLNYRIGAHMNFAQSQIPALVCSPHSEYGYQTCSMYESHIAETKLQRAAT